VVEDRFVQGQRYSMRVEKRILFRKSCLLWDAACFQLRSGVPWSLCRELRMCEVWTRRRAGRLGGVIVEDRLARAIG
jgi:hypothetical protein